MMNTWCSVILALGCFLGAWALTWVVRRYALSVGVIDIPGERSSHTVPTPRGGGIAIVLAFQSGALFLWFSGEVHADLIWALIGAGGAIAAIGFLDDHWHVPVRWRLVAHFTGAVWSLAWLGGMPALPVFGFVVDLGWLGSMIAAVYLVWLLNLYNFMDGIDGIASIEAISVAVAGAAVYWMSPKGGSGWSLSLPLIAAVAGFLVWNFPRARIFMGDVGSGFLGIVLGIFSIQAAQVAGELFWAWVILLGAFIVDATVTLSRRIYRGEKFYEAHRSHAYQCASRKFGHSRVSLAFGAINLIWLFPLAAGVAVGALDGVVGVAVAYGPLVLLAFKFKAGATELQHS